MRIARLVTAAVAATSLVVLAGGAPALAHNALTKATPAKNATVKEAPEKVELTFLDSLDDSFGIEVTDAQKQEVPTAKASVDGRKGMVAFTGPLVNGTYTVTYKLVASDGDPMTGSYEFTVAAPEPSASPAPVKSPAPTTLLQTPVTVAASDSSDSGPGRGLIIAIIAGVVVLAAGAILIGRRRRNP
jgi:methionine-rich copper-binding protein CopC